jgi:hypothetical protein
MMIDMATAMIETTAATSTAMTRSQRLTTTSATYLHHQRQATPMAPFSRPNDRST